MSTEQNESAYNKAVAYIYNIPKFTKKGGIEQTKGLMNHIGNPEKDFDYIHVAGTNGKGSVCAMIEAGLIKTGKKVGLFTSPHLVKINERMKVNGQMISDQEFLSLFNQIKTQIDQYIQQGGVHPTFFEFVYMMAMTWFKQQAVDIAVVETGMGGRLDATNVVEKPLVAVITSISMDHTQYLGNTLKDIAGEKAGIIKSNTPLIFHGKNKEVKEVILNKAKEIGLKDNQIISLQNENIEEVSYQSHGIQYTLVKDGKKQSMSLDMLGTYQIDNSALALLTLLQVGVAKDFFGLAKKQYTHLMTTAIEHTKWPGRMEKAGKNLYIDGAHNEDGICALVETIKAHLKKQPVYLLFAVAEDKDYTHMIKHLCSLENLKGVVVTCLDNERKKDAQIVADTFEKNGHALIKWAYNIKEALDMAVTMAGTDVLCCCGSLYLAGSIKQLIKEL